MSRKRVHVSFAVAAQLVPGTIFRGRVIETISVYGKDAVVTLVGPQVAPIANPVDDHRFAPRSWRP